MKATAVVCVLSLLFVFNHPSLSLSSLSSCHSLFLLPLPLALPFFYCFLILCIAFFELYYSVSIPNIPLLSFRVVPNETCISGVIILPLLSSTISARLHSLCLSFSLLALVLYCIRYRRWPVYATNGSDSGSDCSRRSYAVVVCAAGLIAIFATHLIVFPLFPLLLLSSPAPPASQSQPQPQPQLPLFGVLYLFGCLLVFERIFHFITTRISGVFTFSDTILVSSFLFFCFESASLLTFARPLISLLPPSHSHSAQSSQFLYSYVHSMVLRQLFVHEYHIVAILLVTFGILLAIILAFIYNHRMILTITTTNNNNNNNTVFSLRLLAECGIICFSILFAFGWVDFVLRQRAAIATDFDFDFGDVINNNDVDVGVNVDVNIHFSDLLSVISDVVTKRKHALIIFHWVITLIIAFQITPIPSLDSGTAADAAGAAVAAVPVVPRIRIVILRKYFHGWCLILFVPVLIFAITDDDFMFISLAFAIALFFFIVVEGIRVTDFMQLRKMIEEYCRPLLDERDGGKLVLTHIWLLIGCAVPVWYAQIAPKNKYQLMYSSSGILILGIGDACAAIIGSRYGTLSWPASAKTIEGTLAGIITTMIGYYAVMWMNRSGTAITTTEVMMKVSLVITVTFIFEAITKQIDNLYLPLFACLFVDVVIYEGTT